MATGVPETDVFAAADAVLARGERPTVERVRTELGCGSPARVGQLLEVWWQRLAERLKGHALLPALPGEVAQGFAEVWRLALVHAETDARATLTEDQNALFAAQTTLTQERKMWELALAEAQAQVAESATKLGQAELQFNERQTLIVQLITQVADLRQEGDRLQTQCEQQRADLDALRAERESAHEHARVVENRAHQLVDQTRQELKALRQQGEREQREHDKRVAQLTTQLDSLRSELRAAEQTAAHQAGRVAALEGALAQRQRASAAKPKGATRIQKATTPRRASKKTTPSRGRT
jgi:chromosome segregation ATPase